MAESHWFLSEKFVILPTHHQIWSSDILENGDQQRTFEGKFGSYWPSGFRREDEKVKADR